MRYTVGTHTYVISHATLSILVFLFVFELVLKAISLWRAGKNNQLALFIAILIFNTAGILEIIYLIFFSVKSKPSRSDNS